MEVMEVMQKLQTGAFNVRPFDLHPACVPVVSRLRFRFQIPASRSTFWSFTARF
ncbi:MAG: hypothetical protein JWR14_2630 [Caballeronia sp.]|jgi:hypothetical protein|nr:hypothetical protein [Caballeronia sp.]